MRKLVSLFVLCVLAAVLPAVTITQTNILTGISGPGNYALTVEVDNSAGTYSGVYVVIYDILATISGPSGAPDFVFDNQIPLWLPIAWTVAPGDIVTIGGLGALFPSAFLGEFLLSSAVLPGSYTVDFEVSFAYYGTDPIERDPFASGWGDFLPGALADGYDVAYFTVPVEVVSPVPEPSFGLAAVAVLVWVARRRHRS